MPEQFAVRTPTESTLEEADRLFAAGKYIEAGEIYAALSFQARLPNERKGPLAYCRMVNVAKKVNARPKSARDWDQIEDELASIQELTPGVWYEESLRRTGR